MLANDEDIDNPSSLTISAISILPQHGEVAIVGDRTLYYSPDAEYSGANSLDYIVSDNFKTDTARVYITVQAVNDPPAITSRADTLGLEEGQAYIYRATHMDVDGPDTLWTFTDYPEWMTWNSGADSIALAPDNWSQDPSFMVIISDGEKADTIRVPVTVTPWNDPPVAVNDTVTTDEDFTLSIYVLANDDDVDGPLLALSGLYLEPGNGAATIADSTILYTPDTVYYGADSLTYIISDGTKYDTARVLITINPVNDKPEIISLASVTMDEGTQWVYQALADDPDGPDTIWTFAAYPSWLNWTAGSSEITGSPGEGDLDTTFMVMVSDGLLGDTLLVEVAVSPVNDPPQITSSATDSRTLIWAA